MSKKKKIFIFCFIATILLLLSCFLLYKFIPLLKSIKDSKSQENLANYIDNLGWKGWFVFLTLQILQVLISFIPGEIFEILSGVLFGAIGGLIICLLGCAIGTVIIHFIVKLFAYKYINKYREKLKTYSFLNNPKKIDIYLFILFFIPGLPKDIFLYLIPFLPIKLINFLIISSIARIPAILSSTIVGDSLIEGNYIISIIIFISFALIGITGILFKDKIISVFSKNNKSINSDNKLEN